MARRPETKYAWNGDVALAGPGEVWVSSTLKDLVGGSGIAFEDRGEHDLKGVPDRWHLCRVVAG